MRVGIGYDIHLLVKNRDLVLGGVKIPYTRGLRGHSDGDVLTHAICDAILGAVGEKDIGTFFPDNDKKYKNIDSSILLGEVKKIMVKKGYNINNVDTIVIAEEPKLMAYTDSIKEKIAGTLGIGTDRISVKAKTAEGIGDIGKAKAIAAEAIVSLNDSR